MKKILLLFVMFLVCYAKAQTNVNVTLASQMTFTNQTCANICGYVDNSGNEYALVGTSGGMSIIDVTAPANPVFVTQIPWPAGSNQLWKEIKVWGNYAYTVSEAGSGVQITDLTNLPGTNLPFVHWTPTIGSCNLNSIHALHIANTGFMYLYGSNCTSQGGAVLCCDLNSNPYNPTVAGQWSGVYIHDGYVRNDTVFACDIYNGNVIVIDFTNKLSPQTLASFQTPTAFTHNSWLSGDSKTVYTTDENSNSFLAAFDVSNLSNISELDRIQATPGSGSVVHNTHVTPDEYLVTSWYKDGITIVDASRPHNLIQVGNYDTYPGGQGNGFSGCWGVYPYLPSKTIVASNINEGLFVLAPTYVRACYLEGNVKDSITNIDLNNVKVEILTSDSDKTDISGNYATGTVTPGTYSVRFSKTGYITKIISNVNLSNGVLTTLNTKLLSVLVGVNSIENDKAFSNVKGNPFSYQSLFNYHYATNDVPKLDQIEIKDATGRIVQTFSPESFEGEFIFGENLQKGLYFIGSPVLGFKRVIKNE
jgi:choice-of-anchor B domain-containing protein